MANAIVLETLSTRKLIGLLAANVVLLTIIFIAGSKGPNPTAARLRTMRACNDYYQKFENFTKPIDKDSCPEKIKSIEVDNERIAGNNVVYYVVLPTDADHLHEITMSRWFQWLIGVLNLSPSKGLSASTQLTYKAALFGRNAVSDGWIPLREQEPSSVYSRNIDCDLDPEVKSCTDVNLFELGSVFYKYYLVNVQMPDRDGYNVKIPRLGGVSVAVIHQNGGFTKLWVAQKTLTFPVLLVACVLFSRQVSLAKSSPLLITRVIMWLGVINVVLNVPLEYLSLAVDAPWLRLWYDCTSGAFLAAMAILWLLFIGEHRMDLDKRNRLSNYWKEITAILVCSLVMFLFDLIERGLQITDPFHSVWSTVSGESTARTLLFVSASCACFYLCVLVYLMVRAVLSMSRKRSSLANVGRVRRLYYEGLITRFKVMVYSTVACGLLTVIMFVLVNVNEMYYKWGRSEEQLNIGSGFLIGMAGLWNLYVLNMLFLYAPTSSTPEEYETVEMNDVSAVPTAGALTVLTKPREDCD